MAKPTIHHNPKTESVFEDLEKYLDFCKDYGYRFDERDLYNWKSYAFQQFNKMSQGKFAKDMWIVDGARRR